MATHYEILGVDERADLQSIRSAYLQRIRFSHPDCNPDCGNAPIGVSSAEINVAYGVLQDSLHRAYYDRKLAEARYPVIDLQRVESRPVYARLFAALCRLFWLTFLLRLCREVAASTYLDQQAMAFLRSGRVVRRPRPTLREKRDPLPALITQGATERSY